MRTLTFDLTTISGFKTTIRITLIEETDGVRILINPDGLVTDRDITAIFFDVANDSLVSSFDASGDDVTDEIFLANRVNSVGSISYPTNTGRFDGGVAIGTTGGDDFIITTDIFIEGASIDDFIDQRFGLRLQGAQGSSALLGIADGDLLTNAIGDFVFLDADADGIQDTGEAGLAGVTVELLTAGNDGAFGTADDVIIASDITDASGKYSFTNLASGVAYQVKFTAPTGYDFSTPNQGNDDTKDSDANPLTGRTQTIILKPGELNNSFDAGLIDVRAIEANLDISLAIDFDASSDFLKTRDFDRDGLPNSVINGKDVYSIETLNTLAPYDGATIVQKLTITNDSSVILNDVLVNLDLNSLSVLKLVNVDGATLDGNVLEVDNVGPGTNDIYLTFEVDASNITQVELEFNLKDNPNSLADWGDATGVADLFLLDSVFKKPDLGSKYSWGDIPEFFFSATLQANNKSASEEVVILSLDGSLTTEDQGNHQIFSNEEQRFDNDGAWSISWKTLSSPGLASVNLVWLLEPYLNPDDPNNATAIQTFEALTDTNPEALELAKLFVTNSTSVDIFSLEYAATVIQKINESFPTYGELNQIILNPDGTVGLTYSQVATAGEIDGSTDEDEIDLVFSGGSFQAFIDGLAPGDYNIKIAPSLVTPGIAKLTLDLSNYTGDSGVVFKLLLPDGISEVEFVNTTSASALNLSKIRILDSDNLPIGVIIDGDNNSVNVKVDVITGTANDDRLLGGNQRDTINGGLGDDILKGRTGDDLLNGGQGNDALEGGTGKDTFIFNEFFGNDLILGFNKIQDTLNLKSLGLTKQEFNSAVSIIGSNTVIDLEEQGTITLQNVALSANQILVVL